MSDREDDLTLIEFLRRHQGISPPPAPDLEARIMKSVDNCVRLSPQRRYLWLVPSAIALGSAFTWFGSQLLVPLTAPVETAEVEEFWVENWDAISQEPMEYTTTSNMPVADEFLLAEPSPSNNQFSAELTAGKR